MASTQQEIPIKEIRNNLVLLKTGDLALVIQTSAVNFGLLSEQEQLAIIASFAAMLNSLSFAIQIVIRSKKLDISSYLNLLTAASRKQTNPLLVQMIERYRSFIETTIRENDVLDKQFYVIVPISYLEVGMTKSLENNFPKVLATLLPRRDHIIRQLARIGLKSKQLTDKELIELFYDIYNGTHQQPLKKSVPQAPQIQTAAPAQPPIQRISQFEPPIPGTNPYAMPTTTGTSAVVASPVVAGQPSQTQPPTPTLGAAPLVSTAINQPARNSNNPFVVEELPDEYGTI